MEDYRKINILHIIDDDKFITYCKLTFDINGLENDYIKEEEWCLKRDVDKYDVVIIHYLSFEKAVKILQYKKEGVKIIWFVWGGDIYQLGEYYNKMLLKKTKRKLLFLNFEKGLKHGVKLLFPNIKNRSSKTKNLIESLKKIDAVVCITPDEIELIKNLKYFNNPSFYHINYINPLIEKINVSLDPKGNDILLGNSAFPTNNHIELIDLLAQQKFTFAKQLIIPLNYGDQDYRDFIIKYANKSLKNVTIRYLTEFLTFQHYQELVNHCGVMIMNHVRQQGLGNIMQALISGVHVYLNPKSPIYTFLLANNFNVSSSLDLSQIRLLSDKERISNFKLTKEIFGKRNQHDKVVKMLEDILDK